MLSLQGHYLKKLKYQSQNKQKRMSSEIVNRLFEAYKNL